MNTEQQNKLNKAIEYTENLIEELGKNDKITDQTINDLEEALALLQEVDMYSE